MRTAIIGGTGLKALADAATPLAPPHTPYGEPVTPWACDEFPNTVFINRHADGHTLLPHEINYRANLWMLRELDVEAIVAVLTVGGIAATLANGDFVLPRQIVDYTWGRAHTFSAGGPNGKVFHADFSEPFSPSLRSQLAAAANAANVEFHDGGVYGCTQGPRLETAAEIDRMERDGCTVVGMTAMPEAALARELQIPYAGLCMVVNPAAGRRAQENATDNLEEIDVADMRNVASAMRPRLMRILQGFVESA